MGQMPTVVLRVQGLLDSNGLSEVEQKLKSMTGIHQVRVNLSSAEARVTYDPYQTTPQEWLLPMAQAGYPIEEK